MHKIRFLSNQLEGHIDNKLKSVRKIGEFFSLIFWTDMVRRGSKFEQKCWKIFKIQQSTLSTCWVQKMSERCSLSKGMQDKFVRIWRWYLNPISRVGGSQSLAISFFEYQFSILYNFFITHSINDILQNKLLFGD